MAPFVFKAPDGKEFASKAEWRDYMLTTYYSYKNRTNEEEPLIKKPGEIDGQMFDIADCSGVTIVLMDHCEQVQIDQVKNSRIFIGACTSSIFIRNCENCVFYTCCRQLRLRDVSKCDFYIYSMSEVHIEFTSDVRFAPFNGGYPEHESHLKIAQLDTSHNLWYDIFDHNDQAKTHVNWSLISELEFENPWFPNGECERAIALTKPGSISNPSSDNNMQSFSFQQLVADAQKLADDTSAYLPAVTEDAVTISDYDIVLSLIMRFGSYKASNEIIDILHPEFSITLFNGSTIQASDMSLIVVGDFRSLVSLCTSSDIAWAVYWTSCIGGGFVKNVTLLEKKNSEWKIFHSQRTDVVFSIN